MLGLFFCYISFDWFVIGNNYDIQSTTSLEEKLKFTILGTILRFSLI